MHAVPPYTELTICYVPLFWERPERQGQLRDVYAFKCRCDRCRLEKQQARDELAAGGDEEEGDEHDHDHGSDDDEEGDDDQDDDAEDGEEGEDEDDAADAVSDDDDIDRAMAAAAHSSGEPVLSRGELNVYLVKYLCPSKLCGGTMAPLADSTTTLECNVCGKPRTDAQLHRQLAKEFGRR
jgi:SET and MYND domain-containing protein